MSLRAACLLRFFRITLRFSLKSKLYRVTFLCLMFNGVFAITNEDGVTLKERRYPLLSGSRRNFTDIPIDNKINQVQTVYL